MLYCKYRIYTSWHNFQSLTCWLHWDFHPAHFLFDHRRLNVDDGYYGMTSSKFEASVGQNKSHQPTAILRNEKFCHVFFLIYIYIILMTLLTCLQRWHKLEHCLWKSQTCHWWSVMLWTGLHLMCLTSANSHTKIDLHHINNSNPVNTVLKEIMWRYVMIFQNLIAVHNRRRFYIWICMTSLWRALWMHEMKLERNLIPHLSLVEKINR